MYGKIRAYNGGMKVALITDPMWLMREMTTLRRLAVGLVGESVRVVRVVPRWWAELGDNLSMTGDVVLYPGSGWGWLRDWQVRQLAEPLRKLEVDVLHVLDASLQRVGLSIGAELGVPVVCSVWSRTGAESLRPQQPEGPAAAYIAATETLAERCREKLGEAARLRTVAPGVYSSGGGKGAPPPLSGVERTLSCVVVGDGRADAYYQALLEGMAKVRPHLPQAMYFFYTVSTDQHRLWQTAERLGLLDQVSLVPFEPGSRDLMVQADVMIQPQLSGYVRTLVLEAMAEGRPIISAADPILDFLTDGRTARLMHEPTAEDWAELLGQLARDPQRYVRLGQAAREYVREHHSATAFLEGVLETYRQVVTPEPIPFTAT